MLDFYILEFWILGFWDDVEFKFGIFGFGSFWIFLKYFFGVLILESGSWILGFGSGSLGFVSMTPATTKETRFLDLFVCTLVGRPWC